MLRNARRQARCRDAQSFGRGHRRLLGGCRRERALDSMTDELMDRTGIAEPDLDFLRMHVDVDAARIELHPENVRRHAVVMQDIAIRFPQGMRQHPIPNEAAIDERILRSAALRGKCRPHGEAGQPHARGFGIDQCGMDDKRVGQERFDARAPAAGGQALRNATIVLQRHADFRMAKRDPPECFVAVGPFGAFGAQKFAPRRRIEIKLFHRDRRPCRECRRRDGTYGTAFNLDPPRVRPCLRP